MRPFRLVAATAVMQLVTSMIRVMSTLEDAQNTAQRQLEAEQKRKGNKVSTRSPWHIFVKEAHLQKGQAIGEYVPVWASCWICGLGWAAFSSP